MCLHHKQIPELFSKRLLDTEVLNCGFQPWSFGMCISGNWLCGFVGNNVGVPEFFGVGRFIIDFLLNSKKKIRLYIIRTETEGHSQFSEAYV